LHNIIYVIEPILKSTNPIANNFLIIKKTTMPSIKKTLDMTPVGMIFHIVKTPMETNGETLEMEWELLPGNDGTPVHIHPYAIESYKVLEGQLEVNTNGEWKTLKQGEELTVNKGVPHTFRNPLDTVTRVYNIHSPAMEFYNYFEGLCNIVDKLSSGKKEKLKMNLIAVTYLSMLMKKYKEEMVSVNPPGFVISVMNRVGKIMGLKV